MVGTLRFAHPTKSKLPLRSLLLRRGRRLALGAGSGHADLVAVGKAVRWCRDDAVIRRNSRGELDLLAKIARDGHRLEQDLVVRTDGCDAQAAAVEDQRAGGNAERRGVALQAELHASIAAGHQLA